MSQDRKYFIVSQNFNIVERLNGIIICIRLLNWIDRRRLAPFKFLLHSQVLFTDIMTPACTYAIFCY